MMKSRERVRWAMRLGTVWFALNGVVSIRPIEGRKNGWWAKVSLKMANSAVGAIASLFKVNRCCPVNKEGCMVAEVGW